MVFLLPHFTVRQYSDIVSFFIPGMSYRVYLAYRPERNRCRGIFKMGWEAAVCEPNSLVLCEPVFHRRCWALVSRATFCPQRIYPGLERWLVRSSSLDCKMSLLGTAMRKDVGALSRSVVLVCAPLHTILG